jgi:hypothetical protein
MDLQYGHEHEYGLVHAVCLFSCPRCISISMLQPMPMLHVSTCYVSITIVHTHVHAACLHGLAIWGWTCSMDWTGSIELDMQYGLDMQHRIRHAEYVDMDIQHGQVCCMS